MKWIKINHTAGSDLVNIYQIHRIRPSSSTSIEFFPIAGSSYTLDFGNADLRDKTVSKINEILSSINLTKISSYAS